MSTRFYRESQLTTSPGRPPGRYPISKGTWRRWIRSGDAPAPIKLGPGVSVWSEAQLDEFDAQRASPSDSLTSLETENQRPAPNKSPCAPSVRPDAKRPGRPRKFQAVGVPA